MKTIVTLAVACGVLLSGCSWFSQNEAKIVQDVIGVETCVANDLLAGKSAEQTAADCGALVLGDATALTTTQVVQIAKVRNIAVAPAPASK